MVTKRELTELKRNLEKERVAFSRMRGCYVNGEKEKVTEINTKFLTLPEEELYKYLDIAQSVFKGKPEEKILTLEISEKSAEKLLFELVDSSLEDDAAVEAFYNRIIESYGDFGNYLILLYKDEYDVPAETANREKQDESELVYSYIICAVCPVVLTPAGLECCDQKIKPRERDWVVQKPDIGFCYPAFEGREPIINHIMYYASDPNHPQHTVMEEALGTVEDMFAAEHRELFERSVGLLLQSEELKEKYLNAVSWKLQKLTGGVEGKEKLDPKQLRGIFEDVGMPEEYIRRIVGNFEKRYNGKWPKAIWFYQKRRAAKHYAETKKNRMRELLSLSSRELLKMGQSDLADEIEEYLEKTR